jgi:methionyl-tRNA formyltransferase
MSTSFKIVFMGTPQFAVASLNALIQNGIDVAAIVTVPDKPAGRGQALAKSAVKEYAEQHHLPLLQPEKLKDENFIEQLKIINADLFVVVAFRMLPEIVWNMPKHGTINLHASLLPNYRGAAPINWAVINGEKQTGATTFFLKHEIDTGDIIHQNKVEIENKDTAGTVHDKLMTTGAELLAKTVLDIKNNCATRLPQQQIIKGELQHAPKIFKDDCEIDWTKPAQAVHNFIRGLSPYPTAWCNVIDDKGNTNSAKIFLTHVSERNLLDGEIATDNKTFLSVGCKDGAIDILEIQLAGKKRLSIKDFLSGTKSSATWKFLSKK